LLPNWLTTDLFNTMAIRPAAVRMAHMARGMNDDNVRDVVCVSEEARNLNRAEQAGGVTAADELAGGNKTVAAWIDAEFSITI
jgi:hypothetical protein